MHGIHVDIAIAVITFISGCVLCENMTESIVLTHVPVMYKVLLNVFKCLLKNSHNIDKKYDNYTYYILTSIKITWNLTCDEKKKYYNFGYDMLLKD